MVALDEERGWSKKVQRELCASRLVVMATALASADGRIRRAAPEVVLPVRVKLAKVVVKAQERREVARAERLRELGG